MILKAAGFKDLKSYKDYSKNPSVRIFYRNIFYLENNNHIKKPF